MSNDRGALLIERVANGYIDAIYEGTDAPTFELRLGQARLDTAVPSTVAPRRVRFAVPASVISDGVSVLEITRTQETEAAASVVLIAGAPYADDLHAQVAQLRAEVDALKGLVRRKFG